MKYRISPICGAPELLTPQKPRCSRCRAEVFSVVQFFAVSGEHGAKYPGSRGSKRSVRLCAACLAMLTKTLAMDSKTHKARRKP